MKNRSTALIVLPALIFIVACAIPGMPAASTSAPAPTVDTELLQVMVDRTVTAALELTEQAAPTQPVATQEPAVTETPSVTLPANASGSSLSAQNDGTTLFVDELAGFQMNVSPGWLPVRINEQEYYDAFSLPAASDEAVQTALMNIKTLDPGAFRLFIYDLQDGHLTSGVITNVNLLWDLEGGISLADDTEIKSVSDELPASVPGLIVDSSSVAATANGLPIGVVLSHTPGKAIDGTTDVVFYQKQVYVNLPVGALVVSFTTEENFKDATLPFFDTMIESIQVNP